MGARRFRRLVLACGPVVMAAVTCTIYGGLIAAPFVFDDVGGITDNPSIVGLWPLCDFVDGDRPLTPSAGHPTSARPLANLSLAINHAVGGVDPAGYRCVNIAIHVIAALLLWLVIHETLARYRPLWFEPEAALLASFAAALLWLVHPLQAECVLYVTQRTESLMAMCGFATLACCIRFWSASSGRRRWLVAAAVACLLGMLSKEVMVAVPILVLLYERTFVANDGRIPRSSWPLYATLATTAVVPIAITLCGHRTPLAGFDVGIPAVAWWLTQCKAIFVYAWRTIWPWPLAIHYQMPYLADASAAWPWSVATLCLVLLVTRACHRRSPIGFLGFCILLPLAPTFVIPMFDEVMADRRMYLPLAAIAAAAVVGAAAARRDGADGRVSSRHAMFRLAMTLSAGAALVLATVSARRAETFRSTIGLWEHVVSHQPDNHTARYNLATILTAAGRDDDALPHFRHAVTLQPVSPRHRPVHAKAAFNLARLLDERGQVAEAIEHYRRAITLNPALADAHYNLAMALDDAGHAEEAIACYAAALSASPDFVDAHTNVAILLAAHGDVEAATEHFQAAAALSPTMQTRANLASMYRLAGRDADALTVAEAALREPRGEGTAELADCLRAILSSGRGLTPPD